MTKSARRRTPEKPSREGFCTTPVQQEWERSEVRETAAVFRFALRAARR